MTAQRTVGFLVGMLMAAGCCIAQLGLSTAVEPALNAPARFGVSVAATEQVTDHDLFSLRVGSGRTLAPGYTRTLAEITSGVDLFADLQAGMTQYGGRERGLFTYG